MTEQASNELRERLSRLQSPSPNGAGASAAPDTADLDWFLFQSFPECEVPPATFVELVPVYERALRAGVRFDYELLFVRVLELRGRIAEAARHALARAALERVRAGGFDFADAATALRFALRALPEGDGFLDDVLTEPALAALRFRWTVDFVLDERELPEYLALSYLVEEGDPIPEARMRALSSFFAADECRARLEAGWESETRGDERDALLRAVREPLPGFAPASVG